MDDVGYKSRKESKNRNPPLIAIVENNVQQTTNTNFTDN